MPGHEWDACYSLNLREEGMMRERLVKCRHDRNGYIFMIDDNGWPVQKLLAWALVWTYDDDEVGAYFYVRKSARGKRLGSQLADRVEQDFAKVRVFPSDKQATGLFDKFNFQQDLRYWNG